MDDERFAHIATDSRFKALPRKKRKVQIDSRFKTMFTSERFKVDHNLDKRGGGDIIHSSTDNLKKYYRLSSSEDENEDGDGDGDDDSDSDGDGDGDGDDGNCSTSSTDIDEDALDQEDAPAYYSDWMDQTESIPQSNNLSSRLALCNMNWDRITALDLYVLFNSFRPQDGVIESVVIYPSDFGKTRMTHEDIEGPTELVQVDEDNPGHIEGRDFSQDKLREYQLQRLKYYYAIIKCDSIATAEHIYDECDGMEYELSSSTIDLRFVPDNVTFDDRDPSSEATEASLTKDYCPSEFLTTALQQSSVQLTWDETPPIRLQTTMKEYSKDSINDGDTVFSNYLASSSSDEEEDSKNDATKYRSLLGLDEDEKEVEKGEELEVTWNVGFGDESDNEMIPPAVNDAEDKGFDDPFFTDETLKKRKKKQKKSKEEIERDNKEKEDLELLVISDGEEDKEHFNLDQILKHEKKLSAKKKRRNRKEESMKQSSSVGDFEVDLNDPRFSAIYDSHHYAIEPSSHHYKPTKAMQSLLFERQRRRKNKEDSDHVPLINPSTTTDSISLNTLVKSVKNKTESFKKSKNSRKRLRAC